jgi:hypothetical protein
MELFMIAMAFVTQGNNYDHLKKSKTSNNEARKSGKTKLKNPLLVMCVLFHSRP